MDITKTSDISFGVDEKCVYLDRKVYASHLELRVEGKPVMVTYVANTDSFHVHHNWEELIVKEHQHKRMLDIIIQHNPNFDIYETNGPDIWKSDIDKTEYIKMITINKKLNLSSCWEGYE